MWGYLAIGMTCFAAGSILTLILFAALVAGKWADEERGLT